MMLKLALLVVVLGLTVAASATNQTTTPTPSCLNSFLYNILTEFPGTVEGCSMIAGLNASQVDCLAQYSPHIKLYHNYICGMRDGFNCTEEMGVVLGQPRCRTPAPGANCSLGCVPITVLGTTHCMESPSRRFQATCTPCVGSYLDGLQTMFTELANSTSPAAISDYYGSFSNYVSTSQLRNGFCAMANVSGRLELCLPLLTATIEDIIKQDALLPSTIPRNLCADPVVRSCLRKGLVGMGVFFKTQLLIPFGPFAALLGWKLDNVVKDFFRFSENICHETTASASQGLLLRGTLSDSASSSSSCAAVMNNTISPELSDCATQLGGVIPLCSSTCGNLFKTELPKLGCCARSLMLSSALESLTSCADYTGIMAALPPACSPPVPAGFDASDLEYVLSVPYDLMHQNQTNLTAFQRGLELDFAVATGVDPAMVSVSIVNRSGTAVAKVARNGTVQETDASLLFQSVEEVPNAANVAVSSSWLLPGENPVVRFAGTSPSSTPSGSSSSGWKIGVGVGVAAAVVLVVGVVIMRRSGKSSSGESQPLTGGV